MKLYRINTTTGPRWFGTQADAKAGTKELGGGSFDAVEVPTDKPNLLIWLNEHMATDAKPQLDELEQAEMRAVAAAEPNYAESEAAQFARTHVGYRGVVDAHACVRAIKGYRGKDLREVVAATVERVSQLAAHIPGEEADDVG